MTVTMNSVRSKQNSVLSYDNDGGAGRELSSAETLFIKNSYLLKCLV
jgi:hypothetical protein